MNSPMPHGLAAGGHEFDVVFQLFPGPPQRSQDLSTLYGPTGAIWIARTAASR